MVARTELGKFLMILAMVWFIFWALIDPARALGARAAFWSAVAIWMTGFLLWLYGDTGVPKPSEAMLRELERYRRFRIVPRGGQPEAERQRKRVEKKQES
ncbi:MAG: hypothetical protein QMC89_05830 [Candidatus Hodarchaeaceae archaeon]|nr:hypothetical protein [Candidatus Hodarchaeaceae archaeon]